MTRRTYKTGGAPIFTEGNPETPPPAAPPANPPTPPVAAVSAEKSFMRRAFEFLALTGISAVAGGVAWEWFKRRRLGNAEEPQAALPPVGGTQNPQHNMFGGGLTVMPLPMPMMLPNMGMGMGGGMFQNPQPPPPVYQPMPTYHDPGPSKKDMKPLTEREELSLLRAREKARKNREMDAVMRAIENGEDDY